MKRQYDYQITNLGSKERVTVRTFTYEDAAKIFIRDIKHVGGKLAIADAPDQTPGFDITLHVRFNSWCAGSPVKLGIRRLNEA